MTTSGNRRRSRAPTQRTTRWTSPGSQLVLRHRKGQRGHGAAFPLRRGGLRRHRSAKNISPSAKLLLLLARAMGCRLLPREEASDPGMLGAGVSAICSPLAGACPRAEAEPSTAYRDDSSDSQLRRRLLHHGKDGRSGSGIDDPGAAVAGRGHRLKPGLCGGRQTIGPGLGASARGGSSCRGRDLLGLGIVFTVCPCRGRGRRPGRAFRIAPAELALAGPPGHGGIGRRRSSCSRAWVRDECCGTLPGHSGVLRKRRSRGWSGGPL